MRDNEKIKNEADNRRNIELPILIAVIVIAVMVFCLVWFDKKNPIIINNIRDFVITLTVFLMFVIGAALAFLCFFLADRVGKARDQLDPVLANADGKIEELADKIAAILKNILNPVVEAKSRTAGFLGIFSGKKTKE